MLHGGEIYGPTEVRLDFSVNINPLGVPENVYRKLASDREALMRYPDQDCIALRRSLAAYTGLPVDRILCGNGASELIEASLRAIRPRRILLTAPSFSGYRRAAENCGAQILYHTLRREDEFALTERFLEDLRKIGRTASADNTPEDTASDTAPDTASCFTPEDAGDTGSDTASYYAPEDTGDTAPDTASCLGVEDSGADMAILCTPSNPVGNLIDPGLLEEIAAECARRGIWLMVDECFLGFVPDEERRTMRRYLTQSSDISRRLLVLDAFTKRFAMPGIRLGYLMAEDTELLTKIHAQQTEWSVSSLAQTAGLAALEEADTYMAAARETIARERLRMEDSIRRMGFHVFPGAANYLFFSSENEAAKHLSRNLLKKGILIRDCSNYPGLGQGFCRAAIKKPQENEILLRAMEEAMSTSE